MPQTISKNSDGVYETFGSAERRPGDWVRVHTSSSESCLYVVVDAERQSNGLWRVVYRVATPEEELAAEVLWS